MKANRVPRKSNQITPEVEDYFSSRGLTLLEKPHVSKCRTCSENIVFAKVKGNVKFYLWYLLNENGTRHECEISSANSIASKSSALQ
jgi:hypothetical protein